MLDSEMLAAVKAGMKGELDSIAVYEEAAKVSDGEVRDFFLERAAEEKKHFNFLLGFYKQRTINLTPERSVEAELGGDWRAAIVSEKFLRAIGGSRQLSAAVSSAVLLELTAIRHYRDWAARIDRPEIRDFLLVLVEWEERHYADLLRIQEEAERYYFELNRFEPF
ncbi:MAG: hypothetical protein JNG85_08995 [Spirochaetaceae bacterium]|nr:hypothetical protein [Spirochaetaceae bacterium]